jgi:rRNA maturation RNase YbeY
MKKVSENEDKIKIINLLPKFKFPHKDVCKLVYQVIRFYCLTVENINIIFINNKGIKRLNNAFLSHNYPTDVISFRLNDGKSIEGEIYIGAEVAKSNSKRFKVLFYEEIKRLIIHGSLHLIGVNDQTREEKQGMTKLENFFLKNFKN